MPRKKSRIGRISKMEAVRRALNTLGTDAKPLDIQKHVRVKYRMDLETNIISAYKTYLLKQAPSKSGLHVIPPDGFRVADVLALKELADRIGIEEVRKLAQALST